MMMLEDTACTLAKNNIALKAKQEKDLTTLESCYSGNNFIRHCLDCALLQVFDWPTQTKVSNLSFGQLLRSATVSFFCWQFL